MEYDTALIAPHSPLYVITICIDKLKWILSSYFSWHKNCQLCLNQLRRNVIHDCFSQVWLLCSKQKSCVVLKHIFKNDNKNWKPQLYCEWHSLLSHIVKENKTTESILVLCNKMSAGRRISSLALCVLRPGWSFKCSGQQIGHFLNNIDCNLYNIIFPQSLRNIVLHRERLW